VAGIVRESLLQRCELARRAVAHQPDDLIALARHRNARTGVESVGEPAEESFGQPVADNLNLIDVVAGKGRDEAAAETLVLRGCGYRAHREERTEQEGKEGASHVGRSLR